MLPMLSSHPQSCLCILHSFWKKKFQHIPKDPTGEEWKAVQIWNHPSYPPENLLSSTPMFNHSASPLNANGRSNKLQCNWNYVFDDCYSCANMEKGIDKGTHTCICKNAYKFSCFYALIIHNACFMTNCNSDLCYKRNTMSTIFL